MDDILPKGTKDILLKGTKAICPGCKLHRVIRHRGVCQTCAKNKVPNRPDRRKRNVWDNSEPSKKQCSDLLLSQLPRIEKSLWDTAWGIATSVGCKVLPEDLVQTAYVVLLNSAKGYLKTNQAVNLFTYARRGVYAAMYAAARTEACRGIHNFLIRLFRLGDGPVKTICSLRGGLNVHDKVKPIRDVLPSPKDITPFVTQHALKRYRLRFNPSGIATDILNKLQYASIAPEWMWRCVGKKMQKADLLLQYENMVFAIIRQDVYLGECRPVVLTVMQTELLEKRRQGINWDPNRFK